MGEFKEFQVGWAMLVLVLPVQLLIIYLFVNHIGAPPMDPVTFTIANVLFIVFYLLFFGLTTTLSGQALVVSFGVGLIRKTINLSTIQSVAAVKNNHLNGWGIRLIPKGILYNISGSEAIEIKFKDSARVVRIGTQDTARLQKELNKRLAL